MKTLDKFRQAVGRGRAAPRGSSALPPTSAPLSSPSVGDVRQEAGAADDRTSPAAEGAEAAAPYESLTTAASAPHLTESERAPSLVAARELLRSGHEAQALEQALLWIQRDPGDIDFRRVAGFAQKALRWLPEAAENLELVREAQGPDPDVLRALGELYDGLGRTDQAIERWRALVEIGGTEDAAALTALGIDLSRVGAHEQAIQTLQAVVDRHPDCSAAFADLGMALLEGGRVNDAVGAFSSARALDPSSAQAHCGLGLAYQGLERWHEATDAFAETERLAPESAVGPFNLGLALGKLGDVKGMRHALLRAASLEPDDCEIRAALERVFQAPRAEEKSETAGMPALDTLSPASMSGTLTTFHLLDLLEFLRIQKQTGTLLISSRHGVGTIVMSQGGLVSVAAPGCGSLADDLLQRGVVTRAALEDLGKRRPVGALVTDEALVESICQEGLLARELAHQILLDRAIGALEQLNGWSEGTFGFHPGEAARLPTLASRFDLRRLVLDLLGRVEMRPEQDPRSTTSATSPAKSPSKSPTTGKSERAERSDPSEPFDSNERSSGSPS